MTNSYKILSGSKLIESLRYGGYKNPAHALAELIDNSIQAGASNVELLCISEQKTDTNRKTVTEIAILDDGDGMDANTLRRSLKFGDGTHADAGGIGRFGVGLPASSFSQCRRVDVYTWKDSIEALHTYLDLDELKEGRDEVPEPVTEPLPKEWRQAAKNFSEKSGTLVVWSTLDKCPWKRANTIFRHSEQLIGRIYRKFLTNGVSIWMASHDKYGQGLIPDNDPDTSGRFIKPNDPLYLIAQSSTPGKWGSQPMFQKDGDLWEDKLPVRFREKTHTVTVRYSIVKQEVRVDANSGATPHGRHAGSNVGISLIRANREIDMDTNLISTYDPRERWWGAEVDFPVELDDFFGITNNKQGATNFSDMAKSIKEVIGNKGEQARIRELREDGDDLSADMTEMIVKIQARTRNLFDRIRIAAKGTRPRHKGQTTNTEDKAVEQRKKEGHFGRSDEGEQVPTEQRTQDLQEELMDVGVGTKEAEEKAKEVITYNHKFVWSKTALSGTQLFDVTSKSGILHVKLNVNHAAYKNLIEVVEDSPQNMTSEAARERLDRAREGLKLLLASWGRYEDETMDDKKRKQIADFRYNWGAVLESFLEQNVD